MSCCEYGSTNFQEMKKTMETEILRVHTGTRELQTAVLGMLSSVMLQSFNDLCQYDLQVTQ
jgi:hypothetical protein